MYKHGLAVMRCQPFHIGHEHVVDEMLKKCEMVTIVLGSTNLKNENNPWMFHERKKMIKNVYSQLPEWKKIRILGAPDINNDGRWASFILEDIVKEHYVEELEMKDYPEVDAYFGGSKFDTRWFKDESLEVIHVDRTNEDYPFVSGTMIRNMIVLQDIRWKLFINKNNHDLIDKHYKWMAWDRL
jgi:nicotinamide mononucleotide adenylyltransferase